MSMYQQPSQETQAADASKLWAGGLATACVTALVAFVGVLIARGVFNVELLSPEREGTVGGSPTGGYVVMAFMGALISTLILQILITLTPDPLGFFSWIVGLVTLSLAVVPFTTDAPISSQIATGLINLSIGIMIMTLLPQIAYTRRPAQGP
ncbi:DUF6069 family protein [Spirillospora sp. NPDC048911]|uniref:DUF6069 family protein n=1 Tax=Spirillospora sp. NPDC048911 TaxID=3364527 RepID=UPI00371379DF